jgi:DNA ligase-1
MSQDIVQTDTLSTDTLYSLDKEGRIRQFTINLLEVVNQAHYRIETYTGILNGRTQRRITNIYKGKVNRTSVEQAFLEYRSLVKEKLDEGYKTKTDLQIKAMCESIDIVGYEDNIKELFKLLDIKYNTDRIWLPLPMLAHTFKKGEKHLKYPCFAQPKLNGVRCLASYDTETSEIILRSREGMIYEVPHISEQLKAYLKFNQGVILDGELYKHGKKLQEISGAARGKDTEKEWLEYHVYDIVHTILTQEQRATYLADIELHMPTTSENKVFTVSNVEIATKKDLMQFHNECVAMGYEGAMARNTLGLYTPSFRSNDLLKIKMFEDEEFEIIGAEASTANTIYVIDPETFVFILKNNTDDQTFKCKPTGTGAMKIAWWKNRVELIGSKVIVRFQERSKDNIPIQAHVRSAESLCLMESLKHE